MGPGQSIVYHMPVVEVVQTENPADYYASTPAGRYGESHYYWGNALPEAFDLAGAGLGDPDNIWLFFLDADPGSLL